ncbi:MAG TPA: site-specific integrase [Candidatus Acidoferrum sp.]|jgi:integrase|nr:site-specific integrase [Candidatus Acidoferrum sp.]
MKAKLTEEFVRKLPPAERKAGQTTTASYVAYDGAGGIGGFGVRVTENDAKTFLLNYSFHGKEDRIKIGRYPTHSAESARARAKILRQKLDEGIDPKEEMKRQEALALAEKTFGELAKEYLAKVSSNKRPRSAREDRDMLGGEKNEKTGRAYGHLVPRFGKKKVSAIDQKAVEKMMEEMAAAKPKPKLVRANRCRALLSHMHRKAVEWGWVAPTAVSPTKNVKKFPEEPRQRWLTFEELQRLEQALKKFEKRRAGNERSANVIRMLIETGSRLAEVLNAEWPQFDLKRRTWIKPAAMVKGKTDVYVPLSDAAMTVLTRMGPRDEGFVFPRYDDPKKAKVTVKWAWVQVKKMAGLSEIKPAIRLHDLRHSFASHLASSGVSLYVVSTLLGHKQLATTQRYAHLNDEVQRNAVNSFGARGAKKAKKRTVDVRKTVRIRTSSKVAKTNTRR